MAPFSRDFYFVRERRSPPAASDQDYTSSRMLSSRSLRTRRSLSLSRLDDCHSLDRGRPLVSPTVEERIRSISLDDDYDRDREDALSKRLRDRPDAYRRYESGGSPPTARLTRGGVPLCQPSRLLDRTSQAPLHRASRPGLVGTPVTSAAAGISSTSTSSRRERGLFSNDPPITDHRSPSYERKRRLSPARVADGLVGASTEAVKKRAYFVRRTDTNRSPSPSTHNRVAVSRGPAPGTSPGTRPDRAKNGATASLNDRGTTRVQIPQVRSSDIASARRTRGGLEATESSRRRESSPNVLQYSKSAASTRSGTSRPAFTDVANEARSRRASPDPVKKVRFADADPELSSVASSAVQKKARTKAQSHAIIVRTADIPTWSHKRPEPKGSRMLREPVFRRRRIEGKTGWSRAEIVWTNRDRALRVREV